MLNVLNGYAKGSYQSLVLVPLLNPPSGLVFFKGYKDSLPEPIF